ncbi:hypothetical protein [Rhodococcus opacus]|uniref:Uncharacterized protein n=1 Tax=Rhodococcus opacus TaxID=37919 RepID=A0AAX3Y4R5_RHOOP|nr:hypothetical protein [Rhodococcus opacus]WLF44267.1 hypothetical protein Q5707_19985 [Rhodococcus opacus]
MSEGAVPGGQLGHPIVRARAEISRGAVAGRRLNRTSCTIRLTSGCVTARFRDHLLRHLIVRRVRHRTKNEGREGVTWSGLVSVFVDGALICGATV